MEEVAFIGLCLGIFGFLDAVVEHKYKTQVAEFVFGFHNISLTNFEGGSINGLLSVLIKNDKIVLWRVALYCFVITCISLLVWSSVALANTTGENFFAVLQKYALDGRKLFASQEDGGAGITSTLLLLPILTLPIDYFSVWITKKIFWQKRIKLYYVFPKILLDIAISLMPILVAGFGIFLAVVVQKSSMSTYFNTIIGYYLIAALIQLPSSVLINLLQISILIVGLFSRVLLVLTKLNSYTVIFSRLHEVPFSFIGLIVGLLLFPFFT